MDKRISWLDADGSFQLDGLSDVSGVYFPLAGESGMKSAVTPNLGGDAKCGQNTFLLPPVSIGELHSSRATRNFWLRLPEGIWSAAGGSDEVQPLRHTPYEEQVSVRAGLMWHTVTRYSPKHGVASTISSIVPCGERAAELMEVVIENRRAEAIKLTPIAAVPLYCRSADNLRDHRHVTSLLNRAASTEYGVEVKPTLTFDERGHCANTMTYFALGAEPGGDKPEAYCLSLAEFIGEGGSLTWPEAVYDSNSPAWRSPGVKSQGEELIAALRFPERTLEAGGRIRYVICLGMSPSEDAGEAIRELTNTYLKNDGFPAALAELRRYWTEKNNVRVETGDPGYDEFMRWVSFQPTLRRLFGCSFLPYHDYGKGGRGWRDLWQDCLALLIMEPENVRRLLVNDYRGVRFDGTNATIVGHNEGEFLADRNGICRVWMDHGFWPLFTTDYYIQFTGDTSILLEDAAYFKDAHTARGEEIDALWTPEQQTLQRDITGRVVTGSVLEHILLQNLTACLDVGEHGHIRLRGADWNDGLDMAFEKGESVAFTAAYAWNLSILAGLLEHLSREHESLMFHRELLTLLCGNDRTPEEKRAILRTFHTQCGHTISGEKTALDLSRIAELLRRRSAEMIGHIRENEWCAVPCGGFYNGYYDEKGEKLEGQFPDRIRMMLTGQVFTMMSGAARDSELGKITAAADALLYCPEIGGYRLNTDFGDGKCAMGRAFGFAYGHKENGAVFSHMAVMYANALYRRGRGRAGHKVLSALYRQAANFDKCRQYPGLPEYFDPKGRGMYPYLTGSASWMLLTVLTQVFGVTSCYGDIILAPQIAREQLNEKGEAALSFSFCGCPVRISYRAPDGGDYFSGVTAVKLDGRDLGGTRIARALLSDGKPHTIEATLCREG